MFYEAQPAITLRPATPDDEPLLYHLYTTTRELEMSLVDWDDAQKAAFLRHQFRAQLDHYQKYYPDATHDIVNLGEAQIGRVYIHRGEDEIILMDITILPDYRNKGVGSFLMEQLLAEAHRSQRSVTLHVWEMNAGAYRFYQRFGFTEIGREGPHIKLEWHP